MTYPFIIQNGNVTIVIDNKPHTIAKTHITYQKVVDAIKAGDWDKVRDTIDPKKVVVNYGKGNVAIQGEKLFWKNEEMHGAIVTRMVSMLQEGFSIEPLILFMENMMQNPSCRAVNELYGFLEKNNLPITPDGHFLAYKRVRDNYMDVHSGTFDNSVGKVCEMERNKVDDNKDNTCSTGLHFCSESYLSSFGGARTVIVKINPRDVVSIPSDYNNAKGRTCRYEVVGEVGANPDDKAEFTKPVQSNANSNVKVEPKVGTGEFCRGYQDGYLQKEYDSSSWKDSASYDEGYQKGEDDMLASISPRYAYERKVSAPVASTFRSSWPLAKG
jgi:hypothetical protein